MKKRILSLILALALLLPLCPAGVLSFPAGAATSGSYRLYEWSLNGTHLTISGQGSIVPYSDVESYGWSDLSDVVKSITIEEGITSIGDCAFEFFNCEDISIADTVTSIGAYAFEGCCLESVYLPDSLKTIGDYAFFGNGITEIYFPKSITSIGQGAFEDSFFGEETQNRLYYAGSEADWAAIRIGSGNTFFDNTAWYYNACLENDPSFEHDYDDACDTACNVCGVTRTVDHVFDNATDTTCNACGTIRTLPEYDSCGTTGDCTWYMVGTNLTITGNGAMENYSIYYNTAPWGTDITGVVIKEGVTTIGDNAFYSCDSLTGITIPDSVTTIGDGAFYFCNKLTDITVDNNNKVYSSQNGVLFNKDKTTLLCYPMGKTATSYTIPNSVTTIGEGAFLCCDALTSISLPESVTTISGSAFNSCHGLTTVTLGNGVTTIGDYAFEDCENLTTVTLGNGVTTIGDYAFGDCSRLENVYYEGTESDRSKISIDVDNTCLTSATWHYNACIQNTPSYEHSYDNATDTTCNVCGTIRTLPEYDSCDTTGDCFWYKKGTHLTISGNGAMENYSMYYNTAPWGTDITGVVIKEGVTTIGDYAFYSCDSLTGITIPDSVTTIGGSAFNSCHGLTTVTLGNGVTTIGEGAFGDCSRLENVCYEGTESDCSKISIDVDNTCLTSATWHYNACIQNAPSYEHSYDNATDTTCNACGTIRTLPEYDSCGTTGDCFWYKKGTHLTITGNGAMADYEHKNSGTPSPWGFDITSATVEEGVTYIGAYAFHERTKLTEVSLPSSLVTIGTNAFRACKTLEEITIPESVTTIGTWAFQTCHALKSVNIPKGVTVIADRAFYQCTSLENIIIPDGVTTIEQLAFLECSALKSIYLPASVTSVGRRAFDVCTSLTDVWYTGNESQSATITYAASNDPIKNATWHYNTCKVEEHVYSHTCDIDCDRCDFTRTVTHVYSNDCDGTCNTVGCGFTRTPLAHVYESFTDTTCDSCGFVRTLPEYDVCGTTGDCFWYKKGTELVITGRGKMADYSSTTPPWGTLITSVTLENGVTCIGKSAFYQCTALVQAILPESVTNIGTNAFQGCIKLDGVIIPDSVTVIGASAFASCYSLKSITIPESVTTIYNGTFQSCGNLDQVILPNSVTTIGAYAFYDCSLKSFVIPESVTTIGNSAFYNCSLTSIEIPESVTTIGESAFEFSSLTSIEIPESVKTIGDYAFSSCHSLQHIVLPNSLTSLGECVFDSCNSLKIVVFPSSITSIPYRTFYNSSLDWIVIPSSVTEIESYAFDYATVSEIWYEGSESDWAKITVGSDNSALSNAIIHYSACSSSDHVYDNGCDTACNICNCPRVVFDHVYSNACDSVCNECGEARIAPHTYSTLCDPDCDLCGKTRVDLAHTYSTPTDLDCDLCSTLRTLPEYDECGSLGECFWYRKGNHITIIGHGRAFSEDDYGDSPFSGDDTIETVVIEEGVTSLCDCLFLFAFNLRTVVLPRSLTNVGYSAFEECALTDVWYRGSEWERLHIAIGDSDGLGFNEPLVNATWHYNTCNTSDHTYDHACDADCNTCSCPRTAPHVFDNACDGVCNGPDCGFTRTPSDHVYDGICDTICNVCGGIRVVYHVFDDALDTICNTSDCGFVRTLPEYDSCGTTGDCYWYLKGKHLIINGHGATANYSSSSAAPWGRNIQTVVIEDGVTTLGKYLFYYSKITVVTIPKSLTKVSTYCFYGCSSLTGVWYEGTSSDRSDISFNSNNAALTGATWYYNACAPSEHEFDHDCDPNCNICSYPRTISHVFDHDCDTLCNIPDCGFTRATSHVFDNACDSDCNILGCGYTRTPADHVYTNRVDTACNVCAAVRTLPYDAYGTTGNCYWYVKDNQLTVFGNGKMGSYLRSNPAPWGTAITSVTIESGVTSIGTYAFYSCTALTTVNIESRITSIGLYAFHSCNSLTSVEIPDTVTIINDFAFYHCTSLANVTIPNSVTKIGVHAFSGCNLFTNVTIPGSVTAIGNYAFASCRSLTEIEIPASVTSIGISAFGGCTNLTSLKVSVSNSKYHSKGNCIIETASKTLVAGCNTSVIPVDGTVTAIGDYAFVSCSGITRLVLPDSVTTIGNFAFFNCSNLTSISFGKSVTAIGEKAFRSCSKLTSVKIPQGVVKLSFGAFEYCTALTSVSLPVSLVGVEESVFSNCTALTDVWYEGSESDRSDLSLLENNAPLDNATWHYNSCYRSETYQHSYDHDCDAVCNLCDFTRTELVHRYQHPYDADCENCGATRTVPQPPEDAPKFTVSSATGLRGDTVKVYINAVNNPGIVSAKISVHFDPEGLELVSVKDAGIWGASYHNPDMNCPYALSWVNDATHRDFTADGLLATLTFRIKDGASAEAYSITLSYDYDNSDIYNSETESIAFFVEDGQVQVGSYRIGDLNNDGHVNARDRVILIRHLAEWEGYESNTFNYAAADLNSDGIVNAMDRVILIRHLAQWEGYETLPM